jgi:cytochrome b561
VPLLFIVIYLTGPLSWGHYFLPLILLLPGLATLFSRTVAIVLFAAFALAWSSGVQETLKQLGQTEFYTVQWNVAVLVALFVCLMAAAYRLNRRSAEL